MKEDMKSFEVYHCFHNDDLVYIGQGKVGRHKHCLSGRSHCKGLNDIISKEGLVNIKIKVIYLSNDKFRTRQREKRDIVNLQPKFNIEGKSRWELLDNKKLRFDVVDILMMKYFYWRGLGAKDLHNIFYEIPYSDIRSIVQEEYYTSVRLPFLSILRFTTYLDMEVLENFESEYSERIKEVFSVLSKTVKSRLKDVGEGVVKKCNKQNEESSVNKDSSELFEDVLTKQVCIEPVVQEKIQNFNSLPSYYFEGNFSNNWVIKEKMKIKG